MSIIEKAVDRLDARPSAESRRNEIPHALARVSLPLEPTPQAPHPAVPPPERAAAAPERLLDEALARIADEPIHDEGSRKRSREFHVDLERLKAAGILTPGDVESEIAEECRLIKRPLLQQAFAEGSLPDHRRNLVMVTSSVPGEGKTFMSISLAMSMAMELDRTVLLVDGDVIRGGVSRALGVDTGSGLTDVLAGQITDLADVLLRTDVPKLTILPAGQPYPNSTELLASEGMKVVTEELSRRYSDRIVVFDSPPLLAASGASVLARLMGQVVLVVEAERTARSAVKESLRVLQGCSVAGFVLNKTRRRLWGGYGSGYGYGYRYGYKSYRYGNEAATPTAS